MSQQEQTLLCRDCGTRIPLASASKSDRCPSCGHMRLLGHPDLDQLSIAHLDCDAFYATVEKRDNPELKDKPVIVGGGRRGVVSAACYIARVHGVHSAMPMFKALKACPEAVVVRPNMEKYVAVGRQVREKMVAITPLVEPISIDEAFLDLTGTRRVHNRSPAESLAHLARTIEEEIGITVSVGLSHNKFLAKLASDQDKPRGFFVIGRDETLRLLASLPVKRIWGVGKAMQKTLAKDGLTTIGDLQHLERDLLYARYGSMGDRLYELSRGIDTRSVSPKRETKSVSNETTFFEDISDLEDLIPILWRLSDKVAQRMKAKNLLGRTVNLKLKTAGFKTRTRAQSLDAPTQIADQIFRTARPLLEREAKGQAFRLIGVGLSELSEVSSGQSGDNIVEDLFDPGAAQRAKAERAMDRVRDRFGTDVINTGLGLTAKNVGKDRD